MFNGRRSSLDAAKLQQENHVLALRLLKVNAELRLKQTYCQRLEYLLHQRSERIDQLTGKLEQSREQVRRLGLENELLAAMIAAPPRSDFAAQSDACWPSAQTVPPLRSRQGHVG
jgi:hypothetical protein